MKLTVIAQGEHSQEWPEIAVWENGQLRGRACVQDRCEIDFDILLDQDQNHILIDYCNKRPEHTVMQEGRIVQDQMMQLLDIRIDDILCASWIITDGYYQPRYFQGYLEQYPDAPLELRSQLIWHFPGSFVLGPWPRQALFWDWYRDQRDAVHARSDPGRNQHREERYRGSREMHHDLVQQIRGLIDV